MSVASPISPKVVIPQSRNRKVVSQTGSKAKAVESGDTVVLSQGKAEKPVTPKRVIRTRKADTKPKELSGLGKFAVLATVGATAVATFAAAKAVGLVEPTILSELTSSGLVQTAAEVGGLVGGTVMAPFALVAGVMGAANGNVSHLALSAGAVGLAAAAGAGVAVGLALFPVVTAAAGAISISAGLAARKMARDFSPKEAAHVVKRNVISTKDPALKELKALSKKLPVNAKVTWNEAGEEPGLRVECADLFREDWLSVNGIRQDEDGRYVSERFPGLEIDVQPTLAPKHSHFKWSQVSFRVPEG